MGRKLDLSGLTDHEAEHVLQVVQRDMRLRKTEEERLSELKQELDEESSRCLLLSRQSCFNQRCCIRCCSPFTFLLNPKRQCPDCRYNVCKACRVYIKRDKVWICLTCQKTRLLKTQSLDWFYTNVRKRFKRFGSAKVLKTLYKKHLTEHSAFSDLTDGSVYEDSIYNEDSLCGSDAAFYRQSEEHSMEETLTVALRVAEEAVDEAISKAEVHTDNQAKQNEANYLREHRRELVEELARTIVQKIITRRKSLTEMGGDYDQDQADLHCHQSAYDQPSTSIQLHKGLWRSHSAFSVLDCDPPVQIHNPPQALKKEGVVSSLSAWKSADRLDNSMLKSPDGNWIALQSTQLSRPSLLTRRKSLVYSALERESAVMAAYEGTGSGYETKPESCGSWGSVLKEIHRKMTDSNFNLYHNQDPLAVMGRRGSRDYLLSDSEGNWRPHKPWLAFFNRRVSKEIRGPVLSRRTSIIDLNFNMEEAREDSGLAPELDRATYRRSQQQRWSKIEATASFLVDYNTEKSHYSSDAMTPDTLTSGATTPEPFDDAGDPTGRRANQMDQDLTLKLQYLAGRSSYLESSTEEFDGEKYAANARLKEETRQGCKNGEEEKMWRMEIDVDEGGTDEEDESELDDETKHRLYRLVAQSRLTYLSTDDELDKSGLSEGEGEYVEERKPEQCEDSKDGLTFKLYQLENEVKATQFSSTEDELDRLGTADEMKTNEELAVKVCRLANQINATQFSSTEDELDRVGRGGGGGEEGVEMIEEEMLWKLQAEKAAQVRDLANLVSTSQFSSTEDELDRVGEDEAEIQSEVKNRSETCVEMEDLWEGADMDRRESIGDLDVTMFELKEEIEERNKEGEINEGEMDYLTKTEGVQQDNTEAESGRMEKTVTVDFLQVFTPKDDKVQKESIVKESQISGKRTEGTRTLEENQPEVMWSDKKEEKQSKESNKCEEKWDPATDSDEDDEEFERIISSMLMMTLEDMQGVHDNIGGINRETEKVGTDEMNEVRGDGDCEARRTNASEETVSVEVFHCGGVTGSGEETQSPEGTGDKEGHFCRRQESGDGSRQQEGEDPNQRTSLARDEADVTVKEVTAEAERSLGIMTVEDERKHGGDMQTERTQTQADSLSNNADEESKEKSDDTEPSIPFYLQEGLLSPQEIQNRYSAVSLRSITTEVLKVLNATEELLQGVEGGGAPQVSKTSLPPSTDPKKLDQQFSRLEENVYVAASTVYGLEAELSDLEECARGICSSTSDMELSFLEEQVASAAAKVQQSELRISDISARIAALKSAGLDVDTQSRFTKTRTIPVMPVTLDSSRQLRRRLPAPPVKDDKET
ncbi:rab effector MyRIP isoform X2 [Sphaeramia orbicularis]|uniref:Rab effector MyRIP-like n=1 Tax=Sphaeramia orbicularis TaxID=375764 RepID=A0A673AFS8_9TELE|nr:rab effector MyRIP-like isoform X2 [Sphaeramia orbicularis]